jgi:hypothetical protein
MTPEQLRARTKKFAVEGNAVEEADESALWLEILAESGICPVSLTAPLWKEADELTRIFVKSRETARASR